MIRAFALAGLLLVLSHLVMGQPQPAQKLPQRPNTYDADSLKTGPWVMYYNAAWELLPSSDSASYYRLLNYQQGQPLGTFTDYFVNGTPKRHGTLTAENPDSYQGGLSTYGKSGLITNYSFYKNGEVNYPQSLAGLEKRYAPCLQA